jgi:diguanylate cyclase (GGDEF)-like protein
VSALVQGLFWAGALVGLWDLARLGLAAGPRLLQRVVRTLGPAGLLGAIAVAHAAVVPWGLWGVIAVAVPYVESARWWRVIGLAATVVVGGGTAWRLGVPALMTATHAAWIGAVGVLAYSMQDRWRVWQAQGVLLTVAILGLAATPVGGVTSAVAAALVGGYVVGTVQLDHAVQQMRHQAETDALTGALTRYGLAAWRQNWGGPLPEGLLVAADLDDFKWINDTWGHGAGDQLLREFVRRLREGMRATDAVCRMGGDEFVLWAPGIAVDAVPAVVARLHAHVTEAPYVVADQALTLGVSMGYAVGPLDEIRERAADAALLRAKRRGKNQVCGDAGPLDPDDPTPESHRVELGWLADAAATLWQAWPLPTRLINRHGAVLVAHDRAGASRAFAAQPPSAARAAALHAGRLWVELAGPDEAPRLAWAIPVRVGTRCQGYWTLEGDWPPPPHVGPIVAAWLDEVTLTPVFQPLVRLADGVIVGCEALVRPSWHRRPLDPATYFRWAHDSHVLAEADYRALAAIAAAVPRAQWPTHWRLFCNIHPVSVQDPAHWGRCQAVVADHTVVWELAERDPVPDLAAWPRAEWALDDYGVGLGDLHRWLTVGPRWLKLDRTLIQALPHRPAWHATIRALTAWAQSCGLTVVAEGVETGEHAATAAACGITVGQGYWWAQPDPAWWQWR